MRKIDVWKGIISHCYLRGELCSFLLDARSVLNDSEFHDLLIFGLFYFHFHTIEVFMDMKSLS